MRRKDRHTIIQTAANKVSDNETVDCLGLKPFCSGGPSYTAPINYIKIIVHISPLSQCVSEVCGRTRGKT